MKWNTVIFDLDGTLTESGEGIKKSFQYALEKMGYPSPSDKELDAVIGPPLKDSFRDIAGFNEEDCDRAVAFYRERYTKTGIFENALYPGIPECLIALKKSGLTLAVASSKPDVMVRQILSYFGIDQFFSVVVGSNLDGTRSSKKAVIDEALRRLGSASSREGIVYVGDRKYDVVGARQCGLSSIGVTYGYGSFEELAAVKPTRMASSAAYLADLILSENRGAAVSRAPAPVYEPIIVRIWRILYPVILYFVISNLLTMIVMIGAVAVSAFSGSGVFFDNGNFALNHAMAIQGIAALITIPFLVLFMKSDMRLRGRRGNEKAWLDRAKIRPVFIIMTILLFMAAGTVFSLLVDLTHIPEFDQQFQQFNDMAYTDHFIIQVLSIAIAGPVVEEMIFRGLVFRRMRDYSAPLPAVILSSVIFGAFHMNLTQGLFAFALGILLALIYERTGRLIYPIAGHMANNLFSVILTNYGSEDSFFITNTFNVICVVVTIVLVLLLFVIKKPDIGEKTPEKTAKTLF